MKIKGVCIFFLKFLFQFLLNGASETADCSGFAFIVRLGSEPATTTDHVNEAMNIFGHNAIRDDRARIVVSGVKAHTVFAPGADKVFHKIHAAAWTHPTHVGIRIGRLDHDIIFEEDVAIEREIAKRREPRWRVYQ